MSRTRPLHPSAVEVLALLALGPATVADVAYARQVHPRVAHKSLRHLAARGLVARRGARRQAKGPPAPLYVLLTVGQLVLDLDRPTQAMRDLLGPTADCVEDLRSLGFSWARVVELVGGSKDTWRRRLKESGDGHADVDL